MPVPSPRPRSSMVVILLLALGISVSLGPRTAMAQTSSSCSDRVQDTSGQLSSADQERLNPVLANLDAAGVQAYVRLLDDTPGGLDDWYDDQESQCTQWRQSGQTLPQLLVLAVSIGDRETGTYFGSQLDVALDSTYLDVHDDMAPDLRSGDYGQALAVGLQRYVEILAVNPGEVVPDEDGEVVAADEQDADTSPPQTLAGGTDAAAIPDEGSSDAPLLWGFLGVATIGAGGLVGRRRHRQITNLRDRYTETVAQAREAYVDLDSAWGLLVDEALVTASSLDASDRVAIQLETERVQAVDAVGEATAVYVATAQRPEPSGWIEQPYIDARRPWTTVLEQVAEARTEVGEVHGVLAELQETMTRAEQNLTTFAPALADASAAVNRAGAAGFRVGALSERLETSEVLHQRSLVAQEGRRLGESADAIAESVGLLATVKSDADGLADRYRALRERVSRVGVRAGGADAIVEEIAATVDSIRRTYAAAVSEPVSDSPDQASAARRDIRLQLDAASAAASMDAQRFDEADRALDTAQAGLDGLDLMRDGVNEVRRDVEEAQIAWREDLAEATRSIAEAKQYATSNARDVASVHLPALARAEDALAEGQRLFESARPDPLAAIRRIQEVDRAADSVLARAQDEKEVRDRLRRRASSKIRSAHAEVRRAEARAGFGLFGWSQRSKESLARARNELANAAGLVDGDPERAERIATRQERTAAGILAEARRRAENNSTNSSKGGGRSFSGGGSRGGGSRGGASRSRGGGSSSFSRGGGSSKW